MVNFFRKKLYDQLYHPFKFLDNEIFLNMCLKRPNGHCPFQAIKKGKSGVMAGAISVKHPFCMRDAYNVLTLSGLPIIWSVIWSWFQLRADIKDIKTFISNTDLMSNDHHADLKCYRCKEKVVALDSIRSNGI